MTEFPSEDTLSGVLYRHVQSRGAAAALLGPGWKAMTYAALHAEVAHMGASFAGLGLGRGSRIATALPSGLPMATALLSTMTWATCAPLDPAIDASTSKANLQRLRIDALIAPTGEDPPAVAAARELGIPILRLSPAAHGSAARFAIQGETTRIAVMPEQSRPSDLALLMQTSGTTGEPKVVPLTQANVVHSLLVRAKITQTTPADRSLCLTPLFISTSIMRSLLAPLFAGGSVVCTPGFRAESFIEWLAEFAPTFFAASPTIHASIVDLLERAPHAVRTLRFVNAGGSALPRALKARVEQLLGVPVIQSYGMTETGTIAQNPLPPAHRRPSSVGPPVIEIAILGDGHAVLSRGQTGEIVVRGPSVISGYEGDAQTNRLAFVDGWFRTGDLGYLDDDGYLFLTGRVKDLINRGGFKVSPSEIDAVLMQHAEVVEAGTCAVAHATLGEDVVSAVVVRDSTAVTSQQLRAYTLEHLAAFKVPTQILVVQAIPKTALGKIKRGELATMLQPMLRRDFVQPADARETLVARIFAEVLGIDRIGAHDNFFDLGGDSLRAVRVVGRVYSALGLDVNPATLFRAPTVAEFAAMLKAVASTVDGPAPRPIMPRQRARDSRPAAGDATPDTHD